jgi:ribonuclease HIII
MSSSKSSCFVATVSSDMQGKLRADLIEQGFTLSQPAHTLFSAIKPGVSCTLYTSGKLTVQGKNKEEFISFYLEPEILKSVAFSYPEVEVDVKPHIGIDESGKGDFFGPLCIAGVQASTEQIKKLLSLGVRDSKTVADKQALALSIKIKETCPHSIIAISPTRYNELYEKFKNLNRLLAWGHATAIAELVQKTGCDQVIIDQFAAEHVVEQALKTKGIDVHLTQRTRAESDPVVAAASILARAAFLQGLDKLSSLYGIPLPKGASNGIVRTGKQIVSKGGPEALGQVAKLHFKTTREILND